MTGAARDWLADAEATGRRLSAKFGLPNANPDVFGEHCTTCEQRWALPADEATCPHKPICEDCWPNGCDACEAQVERDLRHREENTNRILGAAMELRVGADDLSETELRSLDWITRKDLLRHVGLTIAALRRVESVLNAQETA